MTLSERNEIQADEDRQAEVRESFYQFATKPAAILGRAEHDEGYMVGAQDFGADD